MDLGGGEKDDITFHSHTQTTFNFPFTLEYNLTEDSNQTVLKDLLSKCGITGTQQDIDIDYKITVRHLTKLVCSGNFLRLCACVIAWLENPLRNCIAIIQQFVQLYLP